MSTKGAAEGTRSPLEGSLLFTQRALGSRPCLFIVAGSELILPISFRDRTRCVGLYLYIYSTSHIPLFTLLFFFFQHSLANEGLRGADKADPAKDRGRRLNQERARKSTQEEEEEEGEEEEQEEEAARHTALMSSP